MRWPPASLDSFPIIPARWTTPMPRCRARWSRCPVNSPISTKAASGSGISARAKASLRPPVLATISTRPAAAATSTPCSTLARQDAVEYGRTTPVVPRIESPPVMPSRPLRVLSARAEPSRTPTVTVTHGGGSVRVSRTERAIIRRGTGLMAGPPTGRPRPGRGTRPTPPPARSRIADPGDSRRATAPRSTTDHSAPTAVGPLASSSTSARISAPWVTSGSSPASLITEAEALAAPISWEASAKLAVRPAGSGTSTVEGRRPRSPRQAPRVAAAAQAPGVKPVRRPRRRGAGATPVSGSTAIGPSANREQRIDRGGTHPRPAPASGDRHEGEARPGQGDLGLGGEMEAGAGGHHAGGCGRRRQVESRQERGGGVADRHQASGTELLPGLANSGGGAGHSPVASQLRRPHLDIHEHPGPGGQGPPGVGHWVAADPDVGHQAGVAGCVDEAGGELGLLAGPATRDQLAGA